MSLNSCGGSAAGDDAMGIGKPCSNSPKIAIASSLHTMSKKEAISSVMETLVNLDLRLFFDELIPTQIFEVAIAPQRPSDKL